FDVGLQPIDLSVQRLHIALQSLVLAVVFAIGSGGILVRIRVLISTVIERIGIPAVIAVIRVIGRVRIVPASVGTSTVVVGVPDPQTNTGATARVSTVKRAGGV